MWALFYLVSLHNIDIRYDAVHSNSILISIITPLVLECGWHVDICKPAGIVSSGRLVYLNWGMLGQPLPPKQAVSLSTDKCDLSHLCSSPGPKASSYLTYLSLLFIFVLWWQKNMYKARLNFISCVNKDWGWGIWGSLFFVCLKVFVVGVVTLDDWTRTTCNVARMHYIYIYMDWAWKSVKWQHRCWFILSCAQHKTQTQTPPHVTYSMNQSYLEIGFWTLNNWNWFLG